MELLTIFYFVYSFIAFYFLIMYCLLYIKNRKNIFESPKTENKRDLTIVIPCYNEQESVGQTIECFLKSDYPYLKKIIIVDDCSKDKSYEVIKKYEQKYPDLILALQTPKNTGKAAGSKNYGLNFVKTELVGFSDSDSMPKKDAITKMIGFFDDQSVGGVTSRVLVKDKTNFLESLQSIEYKVIAFTRKLMGFIDSIYVTTGPLSIYRTKIIKDDLGGFDENNLTEDIELTWHVVKSGWRVEMSMNSLVYTYVPKTMKVWFKQRIRWNVGGMQTVKKYLPSIHKTGFLGRFIIPFFLLSWFIGLSGLFVIGYRYSREIFIKYMSTYLSTKSEIAIISFRDLAINPTVLFFLGIILFVLGLSFMFTSLIYSKEDGYTYALHEIFIYSFFYVVLYPAILITSLFNFLRGYNKW
ncbi:MAG: glycosyltransferase family 2 protein [Candidatus Nanoarchaeia archaeon]|nr:glycosyltransferase family 2 protein [Candidatus Nanoarchaeia archaeon]